MILVAIMIIYAINELEKNILKKKFGIDLKPEFPGCIEHSCNTYRMVQSIMPYYENDPIVKDGIPDHLVGQQITSVDLPHMALGNLSELG